MSGRYPRTYSRKRAHPTPPISQFDTLVTEELGRSSNQPAPSKTAGHIGKWGVTSFTSIRAINGAMGKDDGYKRNYPGCNSPSSSPPHTTDGAAHNHGATTLPGVDKPVITYKRRKFFKSREPAEQMQADTTTKTTTHIDTTSTSGVASRGSNSSSNDGSTLLKVPIAASSVTNKTISQAIKTDKSTADRNFDLLLSNDTAPKQPAKLSLPTLPIATATTTIPTVTTSRSHSTTSSKITNYLAVPTKVECKPGSGIKLKIFKSRNTESSWSKELYSSKVELPSDYSSASSSSSSSASSPSSLDVNDQEKEITSKFPSRQNREGVGDPPGNSFGSENISGSISDTEKLPCSGSLDSTLPMSSSRESLNQSFSTNITDSTLDTSGTEFEEIIDQKTGLPTSMYSTSSIARRGANIDLHSPVHGSEATDAVKKQSESLNSVDGGADKPKQIYSKNISKSRELNEYLTKNSDSYKLSSPQLTARLEVNKCATNSESTNNITYTNPDTSKYDRTRRTNIKSYGNRNTHTRSDSNVNSDNCKKDNFIDVRNSARSQSTSQGNAASTSTICADPTLLQTNTTSKSGLTTSLPETKLKGWDLFSSDFDEEEIVDRTLVDYDSPGVDSSSEVNNEGERVESPSLAEKRIQELDEILGVTSSTTTGHTATYSNNNTNDNVGSSSNNITSSSGSLLQKSQSMPARPVHSPSETESKAAGESLASSLPRSTSQTTTRKRSIFKSRVIQEDGSKKRATYNHKWHSNQEEKDEDSFTIGKSKSLQATKSSSGISQDSSTFDDFDFETDNSNLKRVQSWSSSSSSSATLDFDDPGVSGGTVTSVKCNRAAKQYYTVIKNVKKLHQLQESGEFQEFNDDVEYFLDALRSTNSSSTRCLAALNLAQKCMVPAFRMHLRAHATVCKFFLALQDAPKHPCLSLCSAMVMFALSQDRLNMDLDRDSLELMLNLLDSGGEEGAGSNSGGGSASSGSDGSTTNSSTVAVNEAMIKIRSLCRQLQKKGHAKHLDLDAIDTGSLALETLLSLTSKRAGEWFKEELRQLGGVDHLIRTFTGCVAPLLRITKQAARAAASVGAGDDTENTNMLKRSNMDTLSKIERCLKVLENVTHQNESNQDYLLEYESGVFGRTLMDLYRMCHDQITLVAATSSFESPSEDKKLSTNSLFSSPPATPISFAKKTHAIASVKKEQCLSVQQCITNTLVTSLKVLVNLTHNSRQLGLGSKKLGSQPNTYNITLSCLLVLPCHLAVEARFEVRVLACCLLLNLVEHSLDNRSTLMAADHPFHGANQHSDFIKVPAAGAQHGAMQTLVSLFYACEANARDHEAHTDQIIDHDLVPTNSRNNNKNVKKQEDNKHDDDLEETVAKLLQRAGRHMEETLVAAYTALLTGYCIMDNKEVEAIVRKMQPDHNFRTMVVVLRKFLHFMDLTATTSLLRSLKPTERVVRYMETLDPPLDKGKQKQEVKEEEEDDNDDYDEVPPSDSLIDAFGF